MKKHVLIIVAVSVIILVIGTMFLAQKQRRPQAGSETVRSSATNPILESHLQTTNPSPAVPVVPVPADVGGGADTGHAPRPRVETLMPSEGQQPAKVVRIPQGVVLAKVNGTAITIKDLVPGGGPSTAGEHVVSLDMFNYLLNRAIERELTFQAARTRNIELTEDQKRQQTAIRERNLRRNLDSPGEVIHLNNPAGLEAEAEFEARGARSQLLLDSLLTQAGGAMPYVTEESVQSYYQAHSKDFGPLPESDPIAREQTWGKIDWEIRNKLAPAFQERYEQERRRFLDQLKAGANIFVLASAD